MNLKKFIEALESGEDYMLARLFQYATHSEYTRYTSTREEDWRMTLREPGKALTRYLRENDQPESIHVDDVFEENPAAAFGILEAKRHRERGIKFDMFLGLAKYVRQCFIDLIYYTELTGEETKQALAITHRFFDKFELGFCSEWVKRNENELIREMQQTNRILTNEKNRYFTVFQSMNDPCFLVDKDMVLLMVNQAFEQLFEVSSQEVIGKKCSEVLGNAQCLDCPLYKAIRGCSCFSSFEVTIPIKDKNRKFSMSGSFLDDISGKFLGGVGILQDITERRRVEEEIQQTILKMNNILGSITDAFMFMDNNLVVTYFNLAAERLLNQKSSDVLGRYLFDAFPEARGSIFDEKYHQAVKEKVFMSFETYFDVEPYRNWYDMRIYPHDEGISVYFQIITERKRAEEGLEASLREKEILFKEIHHRVKNNLTVISSILSLQSQYVEDKKSLEIFRECENRVRTMSLIHTKLYQSKELARIDISSYIKDLVNILFTTYQVNTEAVILKENIDHLPLDINTAIPLGLILNELISNSLKYAFPEGRKGVLEISLRRENGRINLIVADDGVGFEKDLDFTKPTTLGLQLVQGLVQQLQGTIEMEKVQGTVFTLRFKE